MMYYLSYIGATSHLREGEEFSKVFPVIIQVKKLNAARLSELRACCWTTENSDFYHNHSKYERKTSKKFTKKFVSEGRANML